ncbi:hypothetical protein [Paenibacillus sp. N3.4]|nr:hypothetical protein [Paenibacillus sp. N3.4]
MTYKRACTTEKHSWEPLNGIGLLDRLTAMLLKSFKQIVGKQL